MRSIFEAEMKCPSCGWEGTVGTCGDVEHDDGCLDCPVCHSVVIDASPEALRSAEQVREPVYALPESGAVYTFPPQKGDTYQTP